MAIWCCCKGCPSALEITFVGVNAGLCDACFISAGGARYSELDIDGTHTITKTSETETHCTYTASVEDGIRFVRRQNTDCTGAVLLDTYFDLDIEVRYDKATKKIDRIDVSHTIESYFDWTGSESLGVSVSNQITSCAYTGIPRELSTTGTAEVNRP